MSASGCARVVLLGIGLLTTLSPASADGLDRYMRREMARLHIPGASVAIVRDGRVVKAKGYGYASVELKVAASPSTVYEIGSLTKPFTATAIMMLEREGKLRLDNSVRDYLPALPEAWKSASLRHLLTHTSGIPNYTTVKDLDELSQQDRKPEEILALVADKALAFEPGARTDYCNTNYFLLGLVVEKLSGKPLAEYLADRIFHPLSMASTRDTNPSAVIGGRAQGYVWFDQLYVAHPLVPSAVGGAGMLLSSVLDLARLDAAIGEDRLLDHSSLQAMWTPQPLRDGKPGFFGLGWGVTTASGHRVVVHGGSDSGFSGVYQRFPDDRLTVILLTNRGGGAADELVKGIAGFYVKELALPVEKPVSDTDPTLTAKLRDVVLRAAEGTLVPSEFTPGMAGVLFPEVAPGMAPGLRSLGKLRSFTLIGRWNEGAEKGSAYRAAYEKSTLKWILKVSPEGKVSHLSATAE